MKIEMTLIISCFAFKITSGSVFANKYFSFQQSTGLPVSAKMEMFPAGSASTSSSPVRTPKRKRDDNDVLETQTNPGTRIPRQLYVVKFRDAERRLLSMLKDCQEQLNGQKDGKISCQAVYSFSKDLVNLQRGAMNLYGYGKFVALCVGYAETAVLQEPGTEYGEHRVSLKAYIDEKVESNPADPSQGPRDEISWRAKIQFDGVPAGCIIKSVQLIFTHLDGRMKAAVPMKYFPDDGHCTYYGSATYRTVGDLLIFRKPTCQVTMLLPILSLVCEQLRGLRDTKEISASDGPFVDYTGEDAVTLTNGEFNIKVARQVLMGFSAETKGIFGRKTVGTVYTYEISLSKEAVLAVLGAAITKADVYHVNPSTASPMFLYDLMALSTVWDLPPLKLWSQMAFLECLCAPQFDVASVPIVDAVDCIWQNYRSNTTYTPAKFILSAISVVLQCHDTVMSRRVLRSLLGQNPGVRMTIEGVTGPGQPYLQIFVRDLNNTLVLLQVDPWFTVMRVKLMLQRKVHLPAYRLRLTYGLESLDNERTLADYAILNESTLQMSLYPGKTTERIE